MVTMNKYLLAHKNGIYLQRNRSGFLDLLSNLKSLDLKDIKGDINSIGLCVTANSHRVFVIRLFSFNKRWKERNHYILRLIKVRAFALG